jgi:hypothetical protein
MEKLLEPWSRKVIQGAIQINKRLRKENRSWQEVEDWIRKNPGLSTNEQLRQVIRAKEKIAFPIKTITCPKCKKSMKGSDLYVGSEKYKEGYRSYWICGASCCTNKGCGYEKFYKQTVEELIGG